MPVSRRPATSACAVQCIKVGVKNSPIGTAKNANASGKVKARATRQPSTKGTAATTMAVMANWVADATLTRWPSHHSSARPAMGSNIQGIARGWMAASSARLRQINQATMGGTMKAWVKVSDRYQISTIATAVSRYSSNINRIRARVAANGRRQATVTRAGVQVRDVMRAPLRIRLQGGRPGRGAAQHPAALHPAAQVAPTN